MSSAEAVEIVHQMMDDREREQEEARTTALASQVATKYDPSAARRAFWKEVAIYPLTLVCAAAYTLLIAVAQ